MALKFMSALLMATAVAGSSIEPLLWPLPQYHQAGTGTWQLVGSSQFSCGSIDGPYGALLSRACSRFVSTVFSSPSTSASDASSCQGITFTVANTSAPLQLGVSEAYVLNWDPSSSSTVQITADTVWAALHALQTLSQVSIYLCGHP